MKTVTEKSIFNIVSYTFVLLFVSASFFLSAQPGLDPVKPVKPIESVEKVEKVEKIERKSERMSRSERQRGSDSQAENETERSIHKKLNIDFRPKVNVVLFDTDTEIYPTRNNTIEVKLKYIVQGGDKEAIEKLHKAIEENLIKREGNEVDISMQFYKNYISNVKTPVSSKVKMELKTGETIKLDEFEITEIKIYMPTDLDLNIEAKYCKVDQKFSVKGNLKVNGYDAEIEGQSVNGELNVHGKYSKFEFMSVGNTKVDLYESKFKASRLELVKIVSKYSQIKLGELARLDVKGYEDKIKINNVPDCKIEGKYCEIEIEANNNIEANLYEGSLKTNTTGQALLNARYLEADFNKIDIIKIHEGYENEFEISEVKSLFSLNGKYNDFEIDKLTSVLELSGYEDDINITSLSESFQKVWVSGKYNDLTLHLAKTQEYRLYGNIQYFNFNLDKDHYQTVLHDKDGSSLKFDYIKGKGNTEKEIKLEGYEIDLTINYLD